MKVKITYPKSYCAFCGEQYTKTHGNQKYCCDYCRKEAEKENTRKRAYRHYHKHKNRINKTKIGTRTIGPHKHPNPEREAEIIQNEVERIGLKLTF